MALSDNERKTFENDFHYLVERYVQFFGIYNKLIVKKRTREEEKQLEAIQKLLVAIGQVLSLAIQALNEDLFGKAIDHYYYYKEIAEHGNQKAQKILKVLKPLFAASLNARINQN